MKSGNYSNMFEQLSTRQINTIIKMLLVISGWRNRLLSMVTHSDHLYSVSHIDIMNWLIWINFFTKLPYSNSINVIPTWIKQICFFIWIGLSAVLNFYTYGILDVWILAVNPIVGWSNLVQRKQISSSHVYFQSVKWLYLLLKS